MAPKGKKSLSSLHHLLLKDKALAAKYKTFINEIKPTILKMKQNIKPGQRKKIKMVLQKFGKALNKSHKKSHKKSRKKSRNKSSKKTRKGGSQNRNMREPWEDARQELYNQIGNTNTTLANKVKELIRNPKKTFSSMALILFFIYYYVTSSSDNFGVLDLTSTAYQTARPVINSFTTYGGFLLILMFVKNVGNTTGKLANLARDVGRSILDRVDSSIDRVRVSFGENIEDRDVTILNALHYSMDEFDPDYVPEHNNNGQNERRLVHVPDSRTRSQFRQRNMNSPGSNNGIGSNFEEPSGINSNSNSSSNSNYRGNTKKRKRKSSRKKSSRKKSAKKK